MEQTPFVRPAPTKAAAGGGEGSVIRSTKLFATPGVATPSSSTSSAFPASGKAKPSSTSGKKGKASSSSAMEVDVAPAEPVPARELPEGVLDTGKHKHHSLRWLFEDRKDAKGRRPDHPDFDRRTLYVPPSFLADETPAMKQWWQFKARNFDTILFFKVG